MAKYTHELRQFLGFTRTETSTIGRQARRLSRHALRRVGGVSLIALITAVFLIHNLANIGGPVVLALDAQATKPTIDARTNHSVQSPIDYSYESRGYSWFHTGADLVAPTGTPVRPIMAGTVEAVNHDYFGYGNHVIVKHEDGYESLYGHLSQTQAKVGQNVDLNSTLGLSGSTGFSTGPHLHLEIHQNGQLVNPADLVPGVN